MLGLLILVSISYALEPETHETQGSVYRSSDTIDKSLLSCYHNAAASIDGHF